MKRNKNIDSLYRERFRDTKTPPPPEVWRNIAAHLPVEPRKKKLVPLWFGLAGSAAAVALFFLLVAPMFKKDTPRFTPQYTIEEVQQLNTDPVTTEFKEHMLRASNLLEEAKSNTEKELVTAQGKNQATQLSSRGIAGSETQRNSIDNAGETLRFNKAVAESINSPAKTVAQDHKPKVNASLAEEIADVPLLEEINIEQDNALAEIINSKKEALEDLTEKQIKEKRFSITPTAAAVFFEHMGNADILNNLNERSGEVSMVYGVNLAYQLSEKIKIRSGVNKINLNYNFQDVNYAGALSFFEPNPESNTLIGSAIRGSLNQSMGFVEVPIEVEYTLIDKKIGLNIIGGGSSFFLDNNRISLNSPYFSEVVEEGTHLNNVSFTTNIGLGFKYDFSPTFGFNLEPMFKYQINTFNTSTNAKSYLFGIYSGMSFRF